MLHQVVDLVLQQVKAVLGAVKAFLETDAPEEDWSELRKKVYGIVQGKAVEQGIGLAIMLNVFLLILEADASATEEGPGGFVEFLNLFLLFVYTTELSGRLFSLRRPFFLDLWCVMDFLIVGMDLIFLMLDLIVGNMPRIALLRVFRLVRLVRAFKALTMFPELKMLLSGLVCAARAIFWGMLLVMLVLTIFSILAVQLIHPINVRVHQDPRGLYDGCERCPRAFSTVWLSTWTFIQQIVAGDSWGTLCLPITEENWLAGVFFLIVQVTVSLAIMNLILAVIVDSATAARDADAAEVEHQQELAFQAATRRFMEICEGLDADGSGSLSYDEMFEGYDTKPEFAETMDSLGLKREDMAIVLNVLDDDQSGDINYHQLVDCIHDMKASAEKDLIVFIRFYVAESRIKMQQLSNLVAAGAAAGGQQAGNVGGHHPSPPPPLMTQLPHVAEHHPGSGALPASTAQLDEVLQAVRSSSRRSEVEHETIAELGRMLPLLLRSWPSLDSPPPAWQSCPAITSKGGAQVPAMSGDASAGPRNAEQKKLGSMPRSNWGSKDQPDAFSGRLPEAPLGDGRTWGSGIIPSAGEGLPVRFGDGCCRRPPTEIKQQLQ